MCRLFLANQQSKNNEYNRYTQSNLSTDNVPWSAHTNNYLVNSLPYWIKLVVYMDPQISKILSEQFFKYCLAVFQPTWKCSVATLILDIIQWNLTNIIWITAGHGSNHVYVIHVHQTAGEFGQGGYKSKDTALDNSLSVIIHTLLHELCCGSSLYSSNKYDIYLLQKLSKLFITRPYICAHNILYTTTLPNLTNCVNNVYQHCFDDKVFPATHLVLHSSLLRFRAPWGSISIISK